MIEKELHKEKYHLRCVFCGKEYPDDGFRLHCDQNHPPSLLKTTYQQTTLIRRDHLPGMFNYYDWLPVRNTLEMRGGPVTYQSSHFAAKLGLKNLFISFNGYWPERSAFLETCTFKELEAPPTVLRLIENRSGILVVASAGNTARAFAQICSTYKIPLYLVVPASSLNSLWLIENPAGCIKVMVLGGDCDYTDSIQVADRLSKLGGFVNEGGVLNVARRDVFNHQPRIKNSQGYF